jgi:hypothetical protein
VKYGESAFYPSEGTEEDAKRASGKKRCLRIDEVQTLDVNVYREAAKVFNTVLAPLCTQGNRDAAIQVAALAYDKVAPPGQDFGTIKAALALWHSLGTFATEYVKGPLVQGSQGLDDGIHFVKLATVPMEGRMDRAHSRNTGWDRKGMPSYRDLRNDPLEFKHSKGIVRKVRKRRWDEVEWVERKVYAYEFWTQKCNPLNLGSGKYQKVIKTLTLTLTVTLTLTLTLTLCL